MFDLFGDDDIIWFNELILIDLANAWNVSNHDWRICIDTHDRWCDNDNMNNNMGVNINLR